MSRVKRQQVHQDDASKQTRKLFTGSKGGQYFFGPNNRKVYVRQDTKTAHHIVSNHTDSAHVNLSKKRTNKQTMENGEALSTMYIPTRKPLEHKTCRYDDPTCGDCGTHDHKHVHVRALGQGSFGSVSQVCTAADRVSKVPASRKTNSRKSAKSKQVPNTKFGACWLAEKIIVFVDPDDRDEEEENRMSFRKEVYYNTLLQSHSSHRKQPKIAAELKEARMCDEKGYLVYELMDNSLKSAASKRQEQLAKTHKRWSFLTHHGKAMASDPRSSHKGALRYSVPTLHTLDDNGDGEMYNYDYDTYLLREQEIQRMFYLAHELGQRGIIHGDLKVDNFLISKPLSNPKSQIYLSDFGYSGDFSELRRQKWIDVHLVDGTRLEMKRKDSSPIFGWARNSVTACKHELVPPRDFRLREEYHNNEDQMWKDWMSYTNIVQLEMDLLTSHTFVLHEDRKRKTNSISSFLGVSLNILPKDVRASYDRYCHTFIENVKQQLRHTKGILRKCGITSPAYILDKL